MAKNGFWRYNSEPMGYNVARPRRTTGSRYRLNFEISEVYGKKEIIWSSVLPLGVAKKML